VKIEQNNKLLKRSQSLLSRKAKL